MPPKQMAGVSGKRPILAATKDGEVFEVPATAAALADAQKIKEQRLKRCECGCGTPVNNRFATGHNMKVLDIPRNPTSKVKDERRALLRLIRQVAELSRRIEALERGER